MDILETVYAKAKADPQIVAFPEACNEKILLAASECAAKGYCKPLLVGVPEAIKKACE